ncbi:MAG: DUF3419 family protein, partial [Chitinophagales bacterium]|nr:DUF3419 family protein [Chitinophagales bacterium]
MIYYSHVNEDNFAERNIMMSSEYEDLFCIVGSGERLIALLDHSSLKRVHIIDMNAEALFLAELKLTALRVLSVEDYLSFIGFSNSGMNREFVFYGFQQELPLPSREYWNNNLTHIRNGIIHMGHFEQFLSRLRPLLRVLLGRGFYKCFEMPYSQLRSFPSFRWKIVKWLFSKKWSYLLFGNKDIAFIGEDALHKKIPYALHETLLNDRVSKNCM